jgi:hypothetical protein
MGICVSKNITIKDEEPMQPSAHAISMTDILDSLQDIATNIKEIRASFETNVNCKQCFKKDVKIRELTLEVNKLKTHLIEVYSGNMSSHDSLISRSPTGV